MRALTHRRLALCAVLTALTLLVPAALDVAVLWGADHDHGHGGHGSGWFHRSSDHAHHDDSQLEPADPVQLTACAACAGRSRSDVPLLLASASATHQHAGRAITRQASHPVSSRALRLGRPRAPPAV